MYSFRCSSGQNKKKSIFEFATIDKRDLVPNERNNAIDNVRIKARAPTQKGRKGHSKTARDKDYQVSQIFPPVRFEKADWNLREF